MFQLRDAIQEALEMRTSDGDDVDASKFFPPDHKFAMRVTRGGSCCKNCQWVSDDGKTCGNEYFQRWQREIEGKEGDGTLPEPDDEYCCDLWRGA